MVRYDFTRIVARPTLKPDPISYYDVGMLIAAKNAEVVVSLRSK